MNRKEASNPKQVMRVDSITSYHLPDGKVRHEISFQTMDGVSHLVAFDTVSELRPREVPPALSSALRRAIERFESLPSSDHF